MPRHPHLFGWKEFQYGPFRTTTSDQLLSRVGNRGRHGLCDWIFEGASIQAGKNIARSGGRATELNTDDLSLMLMAVAD